MIPIYFSPCPNDTFVLCAILQKHIKLRRAWKIELYDIETLNEKAIEANAKSSPFLTKVSSGALPLLNHFHLLPCGMAYTEQAGPVLVVSAQAQNRELSSWSILSPGKNTTAFALANHLLGISKNILHTRYDKIISLIKENKADAGILIHESRFTYPEYGLKKVYDLGQLWQDRKKLPLILAAVVAHKNLSSEIIEDFILDFQASLTWAWNHRKEATAFAQEHAQEKDLKVVEAHITHFVTDYTHSAHALCFESLKEMGCHASPFHLRHNT